MKLTVKGKQLDVGEALRSHTQTTLQDTVAKYFSTPLDAQVTFSRDAHLFHVEATVHAGRGIMVQSTGNATDPYVALDEVIGKLGKSLRRYKNKLKDHHKADVAAHAPQLAQYNVLHGHHAEGTEEAADNPVVVAEMTTPIDLLTVSEAVMRLDLGNLSALLFRNRAHGKINMIYRRADGHIGWVDPAHNIEQNQIPHADDALKNKVG
jgi:ribosomal subunit interface protein